MKFIAERYLVVIGILLCALGGCANHQTFQEGKALLNQGKVKEGLTQLKKATSEQPRNVEYKSYYYQQRETWVARLIKEADKAEEASHWDEAESIYKNVLEIDPGNSRARDGSKTVESGRQIEKRLLRAEELLESGDTENAKEIIRLVLAEDPNNSRARNLHTKIAQRRIGTTSSPHLQARFQKPVTLEFRDANIKVVFELLSKTAGINFILDKEIRGDSKVSVFVKNTSIETALQNILSTSQLSKKILNENSILIYPNSKKSDYEEFVVRTFYLNNVEPKQAQDLIKTVLKTKDMFIDEQLNILVMRDNPEVVRLAEKLIGAYDLSDPEVLLEVEILEISANRLKELGIRWPNELAVSVSGTDGTPGQLTFDEARNFNSKLGRISITDPTLVLSLRETEGASNLLANPHIRVKNRKKAKVHIGDRVPVITNTSTSTGFVAETVSYLDVGLKLNVEPSIMMNDEVSIDIGLEVSNIVSEIVSNNGTLTYRLGTRNAATTLRMRNGETQVLAGLLSDEERSAVDRVPGLSRLPIIGRLFSSKNSNHNKTEIVLLITPRIIRNIVAPHASFVEFSLGTETGNAPASMSSVSTPIQILPMEKPQPQLPQIDSVDEPYSQQTPVPEQLNIPPPPLLPQPALQPPPEP